MTPGVTLTRAATTYAVVSSSQEITQGLPRENFRDTIQFAMTELTPESFMMAAKVRMKRMNSQVSLPNAAVNAPVMLYISVQPSSTMPSRAGQTMSTVLKA